MSEFEQLYRELILDHYKNPRNHGVLEPADARAEGQNPLCGDEITVFVHEDGDKVLDVAFVGQGCSISQSSASMMTELNGEPPRPGNTAGFAVLMGTPDEVDAAAARVGDAGHTVVHPPFDAPWGQRYATVADPDGYRVDLFCAVPTG